MTTEKIGTQLKTTTNQLVHGYTLSGNMWNKKGTSSQIRKQFWALMSRIVSFRVEFFKVFIFFLFGDIYLMFLCVIKVKFLFINFSF